jgi:hypothetical protein
MKCLSGSLGQKANLASFHRSCLESLAQPHIGSSNQVHLCPICQLHSFMRGFDESKFDLEGAIELFTIMEKGAWSRKTKATDKLADRAYSLKREFELVHENGRIGDMTHRGRDRNRNRPFAAIRDEWVRGIRLKFEKLNDAMLDTHFTRADEFRI